MVHKWGMYRKFQGRGRNRSDGTHWCCMNIQALVSTMIWAEDTYMQRILNISWVLTHNDFLQLSREAFCPPCHFTVSVVSIRWILIPNPLAHILLSQRTHPSYLQVACTHAPSSITNIRTFHFQYPVPRNP